MAIQDLGQGVRVRRVDASCIEVETDGLALPWTTRVGDHPGTAITFEGESYEVVSVSPADDRTSWRLVVWVDGEAMRVVLRLDAGEVARLAACAASERRAVRRSWWIWAVAPVLALAPASFQRSWRCDWGFPATGATILSAVAEIAVGMLGVIQGLAVAFGGEWFLPGPARVFVILGPVMFLEGTARLHSSLAADAPMGSLIGLPLMLWGRRKGSESSRLVARDSEPPPAPNPVRTAAITALSCLASRDLQERWARYLKVRPAWLTALSSVAELVGGVVNLERASAGELDAQLAVNLFFLIEGVTRLALLAATGRPVGSLLGLPLGPILNRLISNPDDPKTTDKPNA